MRRSPAWVVAVGVMAMWTAIPARVQAADGFWVTLAAGASGASTPSEYAEFSFDSPHAPIVINQLTGGFTAQTTTGGGTTFFSALGTPILLPTNDGYATLTPNGGVTPSAALSRFGGSPMASGVPQTVPAPPGSNLLSVDQSQPGSNGSRVVTVGVTDSNGNPLGQGHITVPTDGWWVIGLGTAALDQSTGPVDPPPSGPNDPPPPPGDPNPPPSDPPTSPPPNGGTVTTPEPASVLLLGVGGLVTTTWRRLRRR